MSAQNLTLDEQQAEVFRLADTEVGVLVPIRGGWTALVDQDVAVQSMSMSAQQVERTVYVTAAGVGSLHRFVASAQPGEQVDHINRIGLDDRRVNLRIVTTSQNMMNQGRHRDGSSRYKGVSWEASRSRWLAGIKVGDDKIKLGRFLSEEAAAWCYDQAALAHFGEFARINGVADPGDDGSYRRPVYDEADRVRALTAVLALKSTRKAADTTGVGLWKIKAWVKEAGLDLSSHQRACGAATRKYPDEKACEWCGTIYRPPPTNRARKSCSQACATALTKKNRGY